MTGPIRVGEAHASLWSRASRRGQTRRRRAAPQPGVAACAGPRACDGARRRPPIPCSTLVTGTDAAGQAAGSDHVMERRDPLQREGGAEQDGARGWGATQAGQRCGEGRRQSGDMGKGSAGEVQRVMDRRRSRAVSVRARESGPSGWNGGEPEDGAFSIGDWGRGSGDWCDRGLGSGRSIGVRGLV